MELLLIILEINIFFSKVISPTYISHTHIYNQNNISPWDEKYNNGMRMEWEFI